MDLAIRGGTVIDGTGRAPTSMHGVASAIGGNCGVGFAPCRVADRQALILLTEGIEDIPEIVMADGYGANIVSGQVSYRDGEATGALPWRLLRSASDAG